MKEYLIVAPLRKGKKYSVLKLNDKTKQYEYLLSFGDKKFQHYRDTTPLNLYENLNHYDNDRKKRYYQRHGKEAPKYSAKWFAHTFLWRLLNVRHSFKI